MRTRTCTKCGDPQPLETNFYRSKLGKDGYDSRCKDCKNEIRLEWRRNRVAKRMGIKIKYSGLDQPELREELRRFLYERRSQ